MTIVITNDNTLFYRLVDNVVKGDDGKLPAGFELPDSNEQITQSGKTYTVFRNSLSYLPGAVKVDNAIESRFLETKPETPPPTGDEYQVDLAIRLTADLNGTVIGQLSDGQTVTKLDESGSWWFIDNGLVQGWALPVFLHLNGQVPEPTTPARAIPLDVDGVRYVNRDEIIWVVE